MKKMKHSLLSSWIIWTALLKSTAAVLNCYEGDLLILLDSSGSVSNLEFLRLVHFTSDLLQPFSLGPGHVRVGLLQVGTRPILEFGLDAHTNQESLQKSLRNLRQLQGDTNTEAALGLAHGVLFDSEPGVPKVLLWLTDGVQPGDVERAMAALKARGVYVVAVSAVHGDFQVLQRAVSPPIKSHLFSVDIYNIDIITADLREALFKIFIIQRLHLIHLTSHSALLQWCPVLPSDSGYYELWFSGPGAVSESRRYLSGESGSVELSGLQPETSYTAFLRPQSNDRPLNTLSVHFITLPDVLSPAVVSVSDHGPHEIRVSWGPLHPSHVLGYTVEYGTIPLGQVHTMTFANHQNSAIVSGLEPETEYLITVTAHCGNGEERAMSVRACTHTAPIPALVDLQLRPSDPEEVQVMWTADEEGLRGLWLSWDGPQSQSQSLFVAPSLNSTFITNIIHRGRVCVSPVYSSGRGDGICCTAH